MGDDWSFSSGPKKRQKLDPIYRGAHIMKKFPGYEDTFKAIHDYKKMTKKRSRLGLTGDPRK